MNDISMYFTLNSNRHPVDQLGELRRLKREIETLETILKDQVAEMMGDRDSLPGDEFIAKQRVIERKGGWDDARLKRVLGDVLDRYRKPPVTVYTIVTDLRSEAKA